MSQKKILLALSLALTLGVTGCASLKGKQAPLENTQSTDQAAIDASKNANANGAETNGLDSKNGLNSTGLAGTDSANGSNGNNANGSNGKNANGEITQADLLNVRLVHFDYDSADLSNTDFQTLQAHAQYLNQNPSAKVLLAGHADERGTREYNMALGERRANAVQAFLNSNGVKSSQLDTVSYGKEKPANDGHDEASWAENRRVEITYTAGTPK